MCMNMGRTVLRFWKCLLMKMIVLLSLMIWLAPAASPKIVSNSCVLLEPLFWDEHLSLTFLILAAWTNLKHWVWNAMRYVPLRGIEISCLNSTKLMTQLTFENKWNVMYAVSIIASNGANGIYRDLALRVYTSRLIDNHPDLVMFGGGNTSCKTVMPDLFGRNTRVLCNKGLGWDKCAIEAQVTRRAAIRNLARDNRQNIDHPCSL